MTGKSFVRAFSLPPFPARCGQISAEPVSTLSRRGSGASPYLSNTSSVDVADAYNLPRASVSLASANATLRPNESKLLSARKSPVSLVIGL